VGVVVAKNLAGETLCVSTRGAVQLAQILVVVAAIWMEVPDLLSKKLEVRGSLQRLTWRRFPREQRLPGGESVLRVR